MCKRCCISVWLQVQEANAQLAEQDAEVTPVQRRIEPRSADDSLSGVVRCLCFADTFLRDGMRKSVLHTANDAYSKDHVRCWTPHHKALNMTNIVCMWFKFKHVFAVALSLMSVNDLRHNSTAKYIFAFKCTAMFNRCQNYNAMP